MTTSGSCYWLVFINAFVSVAHYHQELRRNRGQTVGRKSSSIATCLPIDDGRYLLVVFWIREGQLVRLLAWLLARLLAWPPYVLMGLTGCVDSPHDNLIIRRESDCSDRVTSSRRTLFLPLPHVSGLPVRGHLCVSPVLSSSMSWDDPCERCCTAGINVAIMDILSAKVFSDHLEGSPGGQS